jgi:hypothetical protein
MRTMIFIIMSLPMLIWSGMVLAEPTTLTVGGTGRD